MTVLSQSLLRYALRFARALFAVAFFMVMSCSKVAPKATLDVGTVTNGTPGGNPVDGIIQEIDPEGAENVEITFNDYVIEIPAKAFLSKVKISVKSVDFVEFKGLGIGLTKVVPADGIEVSIYDPTARPVTKMEQVGTISRLMPPTKNVEGLLEVADESGQKSKKSMPFELMKVDDVNGNLSKYSMFSDKMFGKFVIFNFQGDDEAQEISSELNVRRTYLQSTSPLVVEVEQGLARGADDLLLKNKDFDGMTLRLGIPEALSEEEESGRRNFDVWLYGSRATNLKPYLKAGANRLTMTLESDGKLYTKDLTVYLHDFDFFSVTPTDSRPMLAEGGLVNYQGWFNAIQPQSASDNQLKTEISVGMESVIYR